MKKKTKFLLSAFCAAAAVAAFLATPKTPAKSSDLAIENIEVLSLSAAEAWCDPTSDNNCTIKIGNVEVSSKGTATASFN